jgi:hypothetical protein
MPSQNVKGSLALLQRQLAGDRRKGRRDPILKVLRIHSAVLQNDRLLRDYCRRRRADDNLDMFNTMLAEQGQGVDITFRIPTAKDCEKFKQDGGFPLGIVTRYGDTVFINLRDLHRNLAVCGEARIGKTWLLKRLIRKAIRMGITVFIADVKDDYTGFVRFGVRVIPLSKLPWNPLEYNTTFGSIREHCWRVANLFAKAMHLRDSASALVPPLLALFNRGMQPTLNEYARELDRIKSGKSSGLSQQQLTALHLRKNRILSILGNHNCNVRHGFQPHKHESSVVVPLDAGDDTAHELFVSWYAQWQFVYRKANAIRPNRAEILVVLDECGYLIKPRAEFESAIDELIKVMPEFGISLALGSQVSLSATALANTGYKIAMKNGHAKIFQHFTEAMGLTRDQCLFAERTLSVGDAIVQVPFHGEPLLAALLPLDEQIPPATKEEIETSTKQFVKEIGEYATETRISTELSAESRDDKAEREPKSNLMPNAINLLSQAASNLPIPIARSYKLAKLSVEQGDNAKQFLITANFATVETCRFYHGSGRQPVFLQPTQKGIEYLRNHGHNVKVKVLEGRGDFKHRLYQHLVALYYGKKGFLIKKEFKDCDVAIEHPQTAGWIAVEVANGNSRNLDARISANTEFGATRTIIVASDNETYKKYSKKYFSRRDVEVHDIERYLLKRGEVLK